GDHPIGDDVTEVDETWHLGTLSLRERAVAPGDISPGNRNGLRFGIRLGEGPASCGPGLVAFAAVLFVSTAGDHELRTERAHEGRAFAGGHIGCRLGEAAPPDLPQQATDEALGIAAPRAEHPS